MSIRYSVILFFCAVFLCAVPAIGQAPTMITPAKATILVGQSQSFRVVAPSGRLENKVSWSVSGPGASQSQDGAELVFTATQTGEFHITARTATDWAEASVKVMAGTSLPNGTAQWSGPEYPGCKVKQVVPAPPSASGIDVYESEDCPDGTYMGAFTAEGIQVWRRKIGPPPTNASRVLTPHMQPGNHTTVSTATRLTGPTTSICDRVNVGAKKTEIQELLTANHLQVEEQPGEGSWLIEEQNAQCKLWFDSNSAVVRKHKVLEAQ